MCPLHGGRPERHNACDPYAHEHRHPDNVGNQAHKETHRGPSHFAASSQRPATSLQIRCGPFIRSDRVRLLGGTHKPTPLPVPANAIDAAVCVAADILPDRSARHRTRLEYGAGPNNTTSRIINVLAVNDCPSWWCTESDGCKPQQNAGRNSCNCRSLNRKMLPRTHGDPPYAAHWQPIQ